MAAASDWLDAYRAGDIETLLGMYADDAMTECGCDRLTVAGKEALRVYWESRLEHRAASDFDDLRPNPDGAVVSYMTRAGVVGATLKFDANGRISHVRCGPSNSLLEISRT